MFLFLFSPPTYRSNDLQPNSDGFPLGTEFTIITVGDGEHYASYLENVFLPFSLSLSRESIDPVSHHHNIMIQNKPIYGLVEAPHIGESKEIENCRNFVAIFGSFLLQMDCKWTSPAKWWGCLNVEDGNRWK